ncbi:hypothetical protein ACX1C1_04095 [Paenibacillus sp. strain BS8-2]
MGQAAEELVQSTKEHREALAESLRKKGFTHQVVESGKNRIVGKGYTCVQRILNKMTPEEQLLIEMCICETYDIEVRL